MIVKALKRLMQEPETLDRSDPDGAELAAAALMVEAACADGTLDEVERATVRDRLIGHFGLSEADAVDVMEEGLAHAQDSTHLLRFTRVIKDRMDEAARVDLMEMLWAVVLADGHVDPHEDQLLRRIGGLIYVTDQDRGAARRRVERRLHGAACQEEGGSA